MAWGSGEGAMLKGKSLGLVLLVAGVLLELAYSRVTSGTAATDSNTLATVEGQLANLDVLTGTTARVGLIALLVGAYVYFF
jgi:hypothetical protein